MERGGRLLHVVRVHEQRLRELRGGARELGQHEHAVAVGARATNSFATRFIPSRSGVTSTASAARYRATISSCDSPRYSSGWATTTASRIPRGCARRARPPPRGTRGKPRRSPGRDDGDLHEPDALAQLGVRAASPRTRAAGADPLRVVEPVDADEQLLAGAAVRVRDSTDPRRRGDLLELGRVDPHREHAEAYLSRAPRDPVHLGGRAEQPEHRRGEVAHVRRRVEADEVGAEQPLEHPLALREHAEDLRGGERDVEEEPDPRVRDAISDELRHEHELVVDPDEIARLVPRGDRVGELDVHRLVGVEVPHLLREAGDRVVEERPQDRVRVALVVARDLVGRERDGREPQFVEPPLHVRARRQAARRSPGQPIHSPDLLVEALIPVARPPALGVTEGAAPSALTVTGRFETMRSRHALTRACRGARR